MGMKASFIRGGWGALLKIFQELSSEIFFGFYEKLEGFGDFRGSLGDS